MNVCLNAFVGRHYLDKIQEVKVPWTERDLIEEIHKQYPNMRVVLEYPYAKDPTEDELLEIKMFMGMLRYKFTMSVVNYSFFKSNSIPFFLGFPLTDMYSVEGAVRAGVTDVRIGGSLVFELQRVRDYIKKEGAGVFIRVTPNVASTDGLPHKDGIVGGWIRPEDLPLYENLIDVVEFENVQTAAREEAFYRIYFEDKKWDGYLNDIITNFNVDFKVSNGLVVGTAARVHCKQACLGRSECRLCYTALNMANEELFNKIKEQKNDAEL